MTQSRAPKLTCAVYQFEQVCRLIHWGEEKNSGMWMNSVAAKNASNIRLLGNKTIYFESKI